MGMPAVSCTESGSRSCADRPVPALPAGTRVKAFVTVLAVYFGLLILLGVPASL
ncbi:MAG: hypothetical protein Kow0092_12240 [Deferrisomatales bacterium]